MQNKPDTVIGAIMKMESDYIVEWVAWHRLQGFAMIIADNGGDQRQTELLIKLAKHGFIERLDVTHLTERPQVPAYQRIIRHVWRRFDYIGFLDADEFFEPLGADPFAGAELVREIFQNPDVDHVCFNTCNFGSNNQLEQAPEPVMERFVLRSRIDRGVNEGVKSFARTKALHHPRRWFHARIRDPHVFRLPENRMTRDGLIPGRLNWSGQLASWNTARVRHYVVKSAEELDRKFHIRGDGYFKPEEIDKDIAGYKATFDYNDESDPLPPAVLTRLKDEMASIMTAIS